MRSDAERRHLEVTEVTPLKLRLSGEHPACGSIRDLLVTIGSKWAVLIVVMLDAQPKRFSELKRDIGDISQKSLTATLRELEKDGIVERTVTPLIPPRVDYGLTAIGRSLLGPIYAFGEWAVTNEKSVAEARARFAEGRPPLNR